MKNIIGFGAKLSCMFACIMMANSCLGEEIIDMTPEIIDSEEICFSVTLEWPEENISTKSGVTGRSKVASRVLQSLVDSVSLPLGVYSEKGIQNLYSKVVTKGAMLNDKDAINALKVWATLTTDSSLGGKDILYIDGAKYTKNGTGIYETEDTYLWPGSGDLHFEVLANAPESISFTYNTNTNSEPISPASFTYTVPTDPASQNDIVYASADHAGDFEQSVPLNLEHIMAAVNFKVGDIADGEITAIRLKGVNNTGIYNFSNGQWAILNNDPAHKSDFEVKLSGGNSFSVTEGSTPEGTFINDQANGVFMMIPQIVAEGATIEVDFHPIGKNPRTMTASIAGDQWGKDIVTNYKISIDENYNLNITPVGKLLDAHYIIAQVEVTVEGMDDESSAADANVWQLTAGIEGDTSTKVTLLSEAGYGSEGMLADRTQHDKELSMVKQGFWCDQYVTRTGTSPNYVYTPNGNSARGTTSIRGTGDVAKTLVYVMIPENNSTAARNITLTLHKVNEPEVKNTITLTQRAPRWTGQTPGSYGWETVDDDEEGQYGFTYTRKAHYIFAYSFTKPIFGPYIHPGFGTIDEAIADIQANYVDIYAPNIEGFTSFTTINWATLQQRFYMTIDYSVLNNLDITEITNGLKNTIDLYQQGGNAVTTFEQIIANAPKTYRDETGPTFRERDNAKDPAAFPASSGSINDLSGILSYVLKKNKYYLHSYNNGTADINAPIMLSIDDIKWYIPAYGQFATFESNPNITDPNGGTDSKDDYWSSTAGENNDEPANALSYNGNGDLVSRKTELGVIAVRSFDSDTKIIEATATVDNTSLAGGENGDTNQWL